jgi:hypothetical protein
MIFWLFKLLLPKLKLTHFFAPKNLHDLFFLAEPGLTQSEVSLQKYGLKKHAGQFIILNK